GPGQTLALLDPQEDLGPDYIVQHASPSPDAVALTDATAVSGGGGGSAIRPAITETTDASASTATAYALNVGQSGQGMISAAGDHDWFAVNLVGGQTYAFAEIGTGTQALRNTFLTLRDAAGN